MSAASVTHTGPRPFIGLPIYGTGEYGCQYSNEVASDVLPQNAPAVPVDLLVGPEDTLVQPYTPAGVRVDAPLAVERTVSLSPVNQGLLYVAGVKSLTAPNEVEVLRVSIDNGANIARNAAPFDAAAFATARCFCPVDWGCGTRISLTVRGLVPNAQLVWIIFGTLQQSWNSCYPSAGTIEEQAAAVWALAQGRDPYAEGTVEAWRAAVERSRFANRSRVWIRPKRAPRSRAARSLATRVKRYLAAA